MKYCISVFHCFPSKLLFSSTFQESFDNFYTADFFSDQISLESTEGLDKPAKMYSLTRAFSVCFNALCSSRQFFSTPASNLGYLAPPPRTIFHGCQIVHWDPLDGKRRCPQKNFGLGYVKLHGFYANP